MPEHGSSGEARQELDHLLSQFDRFYHNVICEAANGHLIRNKAYAAYERVHGTSPKDGQHPHFAVSSGSHPAGNEKFFVGTKLVGETLVLRTPGAAWLDANGQLTKTTRAFLALVKMKEIDHVVHAKSSSSQLHDYVYDYYKKGPESLEGLHDSLLSFAKERETLYKTIEKNGFAYYEKMGVALEGTDEQKFKQAMAIQQGLWDQEAVPKDGKYPDVVLVYQNDLTGRHYVLNPETKLFAEVPADDKSPAVRQKRMQAFQAALPQNDTWEVLAHRLAAGADAYAKARRESELEDTNLLGKKRKEVRKDLRQMEESCDSSSCSDSRQAEHVILGNATTLRYILRTPGAFWSDGDGNLTPEAARYLAIAAERGRKVSHTHHGNCGAMGATCSFNEDQAAAMKKLPEDFQLMGADHKKLADRVLGLDEKTGLYRSADATVAFYREKTGVNVQTVADCFGLQQALWDYEAASKDPMAPPVVLLYDNLPEKKIYIFHPEQKKFLAVPTVNTLEIGPSRPGADKKKAKGRQPTQG